MSFTDEFQTLISQVGQAIRGAQDALSKESLTVSKVSLDFKVTKKLSPEGGAKFGPIELGATVGGTDVQEVGITLAPPGLTPPQMDLAPDVSADLQEAIENLAQGVEIANAGLPGFAMQTGTVVVQFAIDVDGTIKVFVGAEISHQNLHSVTLTVVKS